MRVSDGYRGERVSDGGSSCVVGVAQLTSTTDIEKNFQEAERLLQVAKERSCAMVFFPETFAFLGESFHQSLKIAEPLDGPLFTRYCDLAKKYSMWVSYGGFQERNPSDPNKLFNTHVIVDSDGKIVSVYRKIHLFDVNYPQEFRESSFTEAGGEVVVAESPAGQLGLSVCYDLRFPELYSALRLRGADVLLVPSAFTFRTGLAHWEPLLRARAIETQCYVIAAAQGGKHNDKRHSYGHAVIINPWGEVLVDCGGGELGPNSDGSVGRLGVAEVDAAILAGVRMKMPVCEHRRPDLYKP